MNPIDPNLIAVLDAVEPFSEKQIALKARHGTPAEFADACLKAVPGDVSTDEARKAIQKYNLEWWTAGV